MYLPPPHPHFDAHLELRARLSDRSGPRNAIGEILLALGSKRLAPAPQFGPRLTHAERLGKIRPDMGIDHG